MEIQEVVTKINKFIQSMDTQQRIEAIESLTALLSLLMQTNSDRELAEQVQKKLSDLIKNL